MNYAIFASEIFTGEKLLSNQAVCIKDGKIDSICDQSNFKQRPDSDVIELDDGILAPGFIDWQVNGGGGILFNNDTDPQALDIIAKAHHSGGTTGLLPTIISDTLSKRECAANAVLQSMKQGNNSILGIHFEGPFFSEQKRGVHQSEYLNEMSESDVKWLCSLIDAAIADGSSMSIDGSVVVTLAPEKTNSGQIKKLSDNGIIVSAGHSNADSEVVRQAIEEGLRGFTHLYNAMRPAEGREPGVVGVALLDEYTWCGIIVDGHHVHNDMVRLAHKIKPSGKLCLISDAMATVGSTNKSFELYGSTITEVNGHLINHEGKLAGSAITMADAVRLTHQGVGIELTECLKMASLYPAQYLRLDHHLGKITPGYRADLVLLSRSFDVKQTWVAGQAML